MERKQYLLYRNQGHSDYVYEYYKENFDEKKHKPFLNIEEFFKYIQIWNVQLAYNVATEYYDCKFNILKIPGKDGNYFMFI